MMASADNRPAVLSSLRGLIFDFDGTLIDASEAICYSFNAALEGVGHPTIPAADIRRMIGRPLREMFKKYFPGASTGEIERYVDKYRTAFRPVSIGLSRPLPGVPELIPRLAPRFSLGIVTSRSGAGTRAILESLGLLHYFPVIVGVEDVLRAKPDPEPVVAALDRLGLQASAAAMVGDTADDIVAARQAKVVPIGVASGAFSREELASAGAALVLDSIQQLAERLE